MSDEERFEATQTYHAGDGSPVGEGLALTNDLLHAAARSGAFGVRTTVLFGPAIQHAPRVVLIGADGLPVDGSDLVSLHGEACAERIAELVLAGRKE